MYIDLTLTIDLEQLNRTRGNNAPLDYMARGHVGTHLDVIDGQPFPPPEFCKRRGLLIDVPDAGREIGVDALAGRDIRDGDFLLFHTGHLARHAYASSDYYRMQPRFAWELVHDLARRKTGFIGLDFPGMRPGREHNEADEIVGRQGGYVIENMTNVEKLREAAGVAPFDVVTGWTGFAGATGLPCRVIAYVG